MSDLSWFFAEESQPEVSNKPSSPTADVEARLGWFFEDDQDESLESSNA